MDIPAGPDPMITTSRPSCQAASHRSGVPRRPRVEGPPDPGDEDPSGEASLSDDLDPGGAAEQAFAAGSGSLYLGPSGLLESGEAEVLASPSGRSPPMPSEGEGSVTFWIGGIKAADHAAAQHLGSGTFRPAGPVRPHQARRDATVGGRRR